MINALSVDVEDYFMVENFANQVPFKDWGKYPLRLEQSLQTVLNLFSQHQVKATFFVLGWVAEKIPAVIQTIAQAGHEIGCHGYSHSPVHQLGKTQFAAELHQAKSILEDLIGQKVIGFRAPTYSLNEKTPWAYDLLVEEGFLYDSSYRPFLKYQLDPLPLNQISSLQTSHGKQLIEYPITVVRKGGLSWPVFCGGYLRLLPQKWILNQIQKLNEKNIPVNLFFHPWELDPDQPKMKADFLTRFRHYVNLSKMHDKMDKLLKVISFSPIQKVLNL